MVPLEVSGMETAPKAEELEEGEIDAVAMDPAHNGSLDRDGAVATFGPVVPSAPVNELVVTDLSRGDSNDPTTWPAVVPKGEPISFLRDEAKGEHAAGSPNARTKAADAAPLSEASLALDLLEETSSIVTTASRQGELDVASTPSAPAAPPSTAPSLLLRDDLATQPLQSESTSTTTVDEAAIPPDDAVEEDEADDPEKEFLAAVFEVKDEEHSILQCSLCLQ